MLKYFDLNRHVDVAFQEKVALKDSVAVTLTKAMPSEVEVPAPTEVPETEAPAPPAAAPVEAAKILSAGKQVLLYCGVLIGVLFSTAVSQFKAGETVSLQFSVAGVVVSAVVALMLIPFTYEKLKLNPEAPLVVQFGLFVQHGVFWQVIFGLIGKSLG